MVSSELSILNKIIYLILGSLSTFIGWILLKRRDENKAKKKIKKIIERRIENNKNKKNKFWSEWWIIKPYIYLKYPNTIYKTNSDKLGMLSNEEVDQIIKYYSNLELIRAESILIKETINDKNKKLGPIEKILYIMDLRNIVNDREKTIDILDEHLD